MAESDGGYQLGRLVLDYIKAFMWPLVAVVVVVVYQDEVRQILTERQVDIFGLRIGERVEQIGSQASAEIEDIRALLDAQRQADSGSGSAPSQQLSADIETKLDSLQRNLSREISEVGSVQQAAPLPPDSRQSLAPATGGSRAERAAAAERRGFEALVGRDVGAALAAFEEARAIWPDYHNVDELARVLRNQQDKLADAAAPAWTEFYRKILTHYSWGLPSDLRGEFRTEAAKAY